MQKEKKKWETPKLICLYRGRLEEAVLAGCKTPGIGGPDTSNCKTGGATYCSEHTGT